MKGFVSESLILAGATFLINHNGFGYGLIALGCASGLFRYGLFLASEKNKENVLIDLHKLVKLLLSTSEVAINESVQTATLH